MYLFEKKFLPDLANENKVEKYVLRFFHFNLRDSQKNMDCGNTAKELLPTRKHTACFCSSIKGRVSGGGYTYPLDTLPSWKSFPRYHTPRHLPSWKPFPRYPTLDTYPRILYP